jgi:hypothetical protein
MRAAPSAVFRLGLALSFGGAVVAVWQAAHGERGPAAVALLLAAAAAGCGAAAGFALTGFQSLRRRLRTDREGVAVHSALLAMNVVAVAILIGMGLLLSWVGWEACAGFVAGMVVWHMHYRMVTGQWFDP